MTQLLFCMVFAHDAAVMTKVIIHPIRTKCQYY